MPQAKKKNRENSMGYKNREIEMKFRLVSNKQTLGQYKKIFDSIYMPTHETLNVRTDTYDNLYHMESGRSVDAYWHAPYGKKHKADFLRLRNMGHNQGQMTAKGKDRGNNEDRIEIDLEIYNLKQSRILMESFLGKPSGIVDKNYIVYEGAKLENYGDTISIYKVKESLSIFLEIESNTKSGLEKLYKTLTKEMSSRNIDLKREPRSLYEIFIKEK